MALYLLFNVFVFTQQYSCSQDQIYLLLGVTRDINAIALNSLAVSFEHLLCTLIVKYSLLPGRVENTINKS